MKNLLYFVRLDLLTLKPYIKSMFVLLAISIIIGAVQRNVYVAVLVLLIYVLLVDSYPFSISEKAGLETLYSVLPIRRCTVVNGRYLTLVVLLLIAALLSLPIALGLALVLGLSISWQILAVVLAAGFLFCALGASLQLPLFFWLGYERARLPAYLPLLLIPTGIYLLSILVDPQQGIAAIERVATWVSAHFVLLIASLVVCGILFLIISAFISRRTYLRRDL